MTLRGRLGALAERNFRLVFTSTTISALGDGVSTIALAFAVLQISNSPSALGAVIASRQVVWEADPWSRGGYAFFDPAFDPALRQWLARPFGRIFFAGEHTSFRWQGYMNGAVESGRRAAAEIDATHRLSQP